MKVGDQVVYHTEPGQVFEDGATTAHAVVLEVNDDGVLVLVQPDGGEPFQTVLRDA